MLNGVAYIKGEKMGPPTKWAAAPPKLGGKEK